MDYYAITSSLRQKAKNKYDLDVLNAIIAYYMTTSNFYESDMIRVFDNYLNTGILQLKK